MKKNIWEKIAHIAGVLALIIASLNIYYTHFKGPEISFRGLPPQAVGFEQFYIDQPIQFTFSLYNSGNKSAFVVFTSVEEALSSGTAIPLGDVKISPEKNYVIEPGETVSVTVEIAPPNSKTTKEIRIEIMLEPYQIVQSHVIPIIYGSLDPDAVGVTRKIDDAGNPIRAMPHPRIKGEDAIWAGCCVDFSRMWHCMECGHEFG